MGAWLPATLAVAALGCGGGLARVANPLGTIAGPPQIDRVVDLGSLPLPGVGPLDAGQSDGLLTPGEWVAVTGKNLGGAVQVRLGGVPARLGGYLVGDGVLLQVPRGLGVGRQVLAVDNGQGRAEVPVQTASYVVGADAEGDVVAFRRLEATQAEGREGLGFAPQDRTLGFGGARFLALSPDGGVLYVLTETSGERRPPGDGEDAAEKAQMERAAPYDLLTVQMGAKKGPAAVGTTRVDLPGAPTAMTISEQGLLAIVTARGVTFVATSDAPTAPNPLPAMSLLTGAEPCRLIAATFYGQGRFLALLEAYGNDVHIVDVSNPAQPQRRPPVNLSRAVGEPFSIDVARSLEDGSLWVLQGPNFRVAGKRLRDGLQGAWAAATDLEFKRAGRAIGGTVAGGKGNSGSRVLRLVPTESGLDLAEEIALPSGLLPLFVTASARGVYVSALHGENPFRQAEASLAGVGKLLSALRSSTQVGVVLEIQASDGQAMPVAKGMAMYGELARLPGGQLLVSTMRLGPGYLPPRLTLDWGFEIVGGPFSKHREVANSGFGLGDTVRRLVPPYRMDRVIAQ